MGTSDPGCWLPALNLLTTGYHVTLSPLEGRRWPVLSHLQPPGIGGHRTTGAVLHKQPQDCWADFLARAKRGILDSYPMRFHLHIENFRCLREVG